MSWKRLKLIGLSALLLSACGNLLLDESGLPETFHVYVSYPDYSVRRSDGGTGFGQPDYALIEYFMKDYYMASGRTNFAFQYTKTAEAGRRLASTARRIPMSVPKENTWGIMR